MGRVRAWPKKRSPFFFFFQSRCFTSGSRSTMSFKLYRPLILYEMAIAAAKWPRPLCIAVMSFFLFIFFLFSFFWVNSKRHIFLSHFRVYFLIFLVSFYLRRGV